MVKTTPSFVSVIQLMPEYWSPLRGLSRIEISLAELWGRGNILVQGKVV